MTTTSRLSGGRLGALPAGRRSESTQVSLEPPPWLELTISSPSGSATRVSPPGSTHTRSPSLTANGRRSTWRGASLPSTKVGTVESCTTGWAIQPRGSATQLLAQLVEVGRVGLRTDHDALAAGAVDRLDDQLVEVVEHVLAGGRLVAAGRCRRCRRIGSSSR